VQGAELLAAVYAAGEAYMPEWLQVHAVGNFVLSATAGTHAETCTVESTSLATVLVESFWTAASKELVLAARSIVCWGIQRVSLPHTKQ
jgi:hypothetical protein